MDVAALLACSSAFSQLPDEASLLPLGRPDNKVRAPAKCQTREPCSNRQTSLYQFGDTHSAGQTVCSQQTDRMSPSVTELTAALVLLECLLSLILK